VGIWNKDEGVLDTRVLATREAQSGQPAGTFGVHRGARSKTSVPPQVFSSLVAVSDSASSRFYRDPPFVVKLVQFHRLPSGCFVVLSCLCEFEFPTLSSSLGVAQQLEEVLETTEDEVHEARFDAR